MGRTTDQSSLDQWYVLGALADFPAGSRRVTRLLGEDLTVTRAGDADFAITANGVGLPVELVYGHLWTTLGKPDRPIFALPEFKESDRRAVYCGAIRVRASGLRVVENFLDLAHFPYVHTDILGTESMPEVARYQVEHRDDVDEIWATKCEFFQPKAAASAEGGQISQYMYRVAPNPFHVMLYNTPPTAPNRWDVIALFVQPVDEDVSIAHPFMLVIDDTTSDADLIAFQQMIFLQDRIVLENQRPRLLPLQPGRETPTRGDLSSVIYRRWLKEKQISFGVEEPMQLARLKLHDYVLSGSCYKVRLLLGLLKLDYERVPVDFYPGRQHKSAAYLALNPLGQLPILEDGGLVLRDAQAILAHLANTYDAGGNWLPRDARFGQIMQWLSFAGGELMALSAARLHDMLGYQLGADAARINGRKALRVLDDHLADQQLAGNDWIAGNAPTIADIACFPYVALSHDCGIGHEDYPAINLWQRRVRRLPGFTGMPGIPDYF